MNAMGKLTGTECRGEREPMALTAQEQATLDSYQASAGDWAAARSGGHFWREEMREFLAGVPAAGRVLDAGCGAGRDAAHLAASGRQVTGLDISSALLAQARRAAPAARLVHASVYGMPFPDGCFDGVWSAAVLLHLPKDRAGAAMQEMSRVLAPGGRMLVAVKQGEGERMEDGQFGPRFFAYYQPAELQELASGAGLRATGLNSRSAAGTQWACLHAAKPQ